MYVGVLAALTTYFREADLQPYIETFRDLKGTGL